MNTESVRRSGRMRLATRFTSVASLNSTAVSALVLALLLCSTTAGRGQVPAISTQPSSEVLYAGQTAEFTVTATGGATLRYFWQRNGTALSNGGNISGSTSGALIVSNISAADAATYDLVITNSQGSITSKLATLSVVPSPVAGTYPSAVMANHPLAYWRFNDAGNPATNATAYDWAGGYNGTYGAALKTGFNNVAGPLPPSFAGFETNNSAAQFTYAVANSHVTVPALNLNTNTVTISAWIYPVGTPAAAVGLVFCRPGGDASGLDFSTGGQLGYTWNQNNSDTWNWNSGLIPPLRQWSFVTLVVSPSNAIIYMCNANGQLSATNAIAQTSEAFNATAQIGDDPYDGGNGTRGFNGFIDEVAVFKSSLTASQVLGMFSSAISQTPVPGTPTASPSSPVVAGTTVTLSVPVTGRAPFQYQWQTNGVAIAGATNNTLVLTNITIGMSGTYDVIVGNSAGSTNSPPLVLTVTAPPPVPGAVLAVLADKPVGYWRLNETGSATNGTLTAIDSTGRFNGTYGTAATDGSPGPRPSDGFPGFDADNTCAEFSDTVADSYVSLPELNLNTNTVTITAWVYPIGTPAYYAGIVFCRPGNDASGMNFTENGQIGYTWNQNNQNTWGWLSGLTPPLQQWSFIALVISPNSAVAYLCNTNGQSSATNTVAHTVEAFNGVTLIGDDPADGGDGSRSFNGLMDEVAIFNSSLTQNQVLNLYYGATGGAPFPTVPSASPTNVVYSGATVVLSETAFGSTPFQYEWFSNSVPLAGATASTLILTNLGAADSASYTVTVSNSYGASNSPPLVLEVKPPGTPVFTGEPAPAAATNYVNGLVVFTATVDGSPPLSLQWQLNGANVPGQTAATLALANLQTNQTGTYTLVASNSYGVTNSAPVTLAVLAPPNSGGLNLLTYHNDNTRQGANTNEVLLTLANVNTTSFGRLFSQTLDGHVYAQPLYVSGLVVPGQGTHNAVFVATEHNTIYAFDADSNSGPTGGLLWQTNLGMWAVMPNNDFGNRYGPYHDLVPAIGITGTPVIDLASGTLYVCTFTHEGSGYVHRIHALNITNGTEQPNSPVVVAASVPGVGVQSTNGVVGFDPEQQLQRPGLTLAGGMLFVAFGSHADTDPYHGWVLGFNATTLQMPQSYVFNTTPNATTGVFGGNAAEGAIWMGGNGLCVDANTNLYFTTGNGSFSAQTNGGDYSDSFIRLSTSNGLAVADYFTPYNQASLSASDADLGSGGTLLLPESAASAAHQHIIVGCGKEGKIYLVDCDNMGQYNSTADSQIIQEVPGAVGGTWSSPAYFNYHIYYQGDGDVMKSFSVSNATLSTSPVSRSTTAFGFPGATPAISANGTQNGIAWIIQADAYTSGGPAVLHAYNATNLSQELYNTSQNLARDNPGGAVKMTVPTIMNGKVYVGAEYMLSVYGNAIFLPSPVISPNGGAFTNGVTVALTGAPGASLYYTLDGTAPSAASLLYTAPFVLTSNAVVQVIAIEAGAVPSGIASASFVNTAASGGGTGLLGEYFSDQLTTFTPPPTLVVTDAVVNFTWNGSPPAASVSPTNFTVRWTGSVQPQYSETYTFSVTASDGARLWVNGQELISQWSDEPPTKWSGSIALTAQQLYNIELDYYDHLDPAQVQLSWSSASTPSEIIPQTQLYPVTNPPPTVVLTSPAPGASLSGTASLTVTADAAAPYNPLVSVGFYVNSTFLGAVSNAPYAVTTTGLATGDYSVTAVATDGSGLSSTSAPVNITVVNGSGAPYGLTNRAASAPYFNMPATYLGSIPPMLSQTGVFGDTPDMVPTNGFIPYSPNVPLWSDGALKLRYFSVPATVDPVTPNQQIASAPTGTWSFPAGTVFVKTFELLTNQSDPASILRLETRLLVRDANGGVYGVTYKWRADNSDADLLVTNLTEPILITTPNGVVTQNWYYPSPADCLTCHTPVANYVLGVNSRQLNANYTYPSGVTDNELRTLNRLGLLYPAIDESAITNYEMLSALTNQSAPLQARARSYLDANCAQCHQPGGTGPTFDARYDTPLTKQNIINAPVLANLGYDAAAVVVPDDVWRSMLYDRVNSLNPSIKMPPLARNMIDTNAVQVIAAWINSLPGTPALAPPILAPNGGAFTNFVTITLVPPDTNATVYYTLNGALPTTNSQIYNGPLTLSNSAVLTANAFESGYINSVAASAAFVVLPPLNTIFAPGFAASGAFQAQLSGVIGQSYILQSSTDLVNWISLSTNPAASNPLLLTDPAATNFPHRFYRAVQP